MKRVLLVLAVALTAVFNGWSDAAAGKVAAAGKPDVEKIRQELRAVMDAHAVTAMSVAVVRGDSIVYLDALGLRSREEHAPAALTDIFRIASISKSFTGVGIMQLVEAGRFSLDDDISPLIGFTVRNPRFPERPITVRMLLSHTSSVYDNPEVDHRRSFDGTIIPGTAPEDTVRACYATYAPGARYQYSNRSINLAGAIIEKVSGERFDDYVLNHILRPLEIAPASFNVDSLDASRFTAIYANWKGRLALQPTSYRRSRLMDDYRLGVDTPGLGPAGGMKLTIRGLAEWMLTLKRGGVGTNGVRVLSEEGVEEMFRKATPERSKINYGLTVVTSTKLLGIPMRGHNGSVNGLKSVMMFSPEEDFGIAVVCSSTDNVKNERGALSAYADAAEILYEELIR